MFSRNQARLFVVAVVVSTAALAARAPVAEAKPLAVEPDPGCRAHSLGRNDDDYTDLIPIGFNVFIGNELHSNLRINNNGFVLFSQETPVWWMLRAWEAFHLPLIAAFHTDVDTRGPASGTVTYGNITFANGRPALCINWDHVGAFDMQDSLLNNFQLILVDRGDRGTGDIDVYMNYDQIVWDDPPGGAVVLPRVGIFDGTTVLQELPGSNRLSALLDGGPSSLADNASGSAIAGRYVFPLAGGKPPHTAVVSGTVTDVNGAAVAGAVVQACDVCPFGINACEVAVSDSFGHYTLSGFQPEDISGCPLWNVQVTPPTTNVLVASTMVSFAAPDQAIPNVDFALQVPEFIPSRTSIGPLTGGGAGTSQVPRVFWQAPLTLTTHGCTGFLGELAPPSAKYMITNDGNQNPARCDPTHPKPPVPAPDLDPGLIACGPMPQTAPFVDEYTANVPPLAPAHGAVVVTMTLTCPDPDGGPPTTGSSSFNVYIDPSGVVETLRNHPVIGAVVTLLRSEFPLGPFAVVPDGSALMSPENRANPDRTDSGGHFAWDTVAGYYIVRAELPGCVSPDDPAQTFVQTDILPVPPAVTDLRLRLDCGAITPPDLQLPTQVTADATTTTGARVTYAASAIDDRDGAVPLTCSRPSGTTFPPGTTMVTCSASDSSGNVATGSFPVTVAFGWSNVLFPLRPDGRNRFEHGSLVPVRFELTGASARITNLSARLFVAAVVNGVVGPELPAQSVFGRFGNAFRYQFWDRAYELDWFTHHLPEGHYQLRIDLGDGISHTVPIHLR